MQVINETPETSINAPRGIPFTERLKLQIRVKLAK